MIRPSPIQAASEIWKEGFPEREHKHEKHHNGYSVSGMFGRTNVEQRKR
jgi:hypothetical protein